MGVPFSPLLPLRQVLSSPSLSLSSYLYRGALKRQLFIVEQDIHVVDVDFKGIFLTFHSEKSQGKLLSELCMGTAMSGVEIVEGKRSMERQSCIRQEPCAL